MKGIILQLYLGFAIGTSSLLSEVLTLLGGNVKLREQYIPKKERKERRQEKRKELKKKFISDVCRPLYVWNVSDLLLYKGVVTLRKSRFCF